MRTYTAIFRQLSFRLDRKTPSRVKDPNTATKTRSPMPYSLASLRLVFSIDLSGMGMAAGGGWEAREHGRRWGA